MRLRVATTNKRKIISEVKKQIQLNNMDYKNNKSDIYIDEINIINNNLTYGYINTVGNGELQ